VTAYEFVEREKATHPVRAVCRVLGVSPSGYYAWRTRAPSARAQADTQLATRVAHIYRASGGTYGAPRIHAELAATGSTCGRKRVARLMRQAGLVGCHRRRRVKTRLGDLSLIMDTLSSHTSGPIREWLTAHPRVEQVPLPTGACWLNLQEGWWRLFRRDALAGQDFCDAEEIDHARALATQQLNARAKPWVWGRPPPRQRHLRRRFVYAL
jgi:transposase InsO family protein